MQLVRVERAEETVRPLRDVAREPPPLDVRPRLLVQAELLVQVVQRAGLTLRHHVALLLLGAPDLPVVPLLLVARHQVVLPQAEITTRLHAVPHRVLLLLTLPLVAAAALEEVVPQEVALALAAVLPVVLEDDR